VADHGRKDDRAPLTGPGHSLRLPSRSIGRRAANFCSGDAGRIVADSRGIAAGTAVDVGAQLKASIDQLREQRLELVSNFEPPEPPAREDQQAELRKDLQTISSGLQADAVIENQRAVEETARGSEVAVEREQRQTVRANQTEVRNIQASKRQLNQEAQRADQAIRQLQSESARLKNSAPTSGTALNVLAQ